LPFYQFKKNVLEDTPVFDLLQKQAMFAAFFGWLGLSLNQGNYFSRSKNKHS